MATNDGTRRCGKGTRVYHFQHCVAFYCSRDITSNSWFRDLRSMKISFCRSYLLEIANKVACRRVKNTFKKNFMQRVTPNFLCKKEACCKDRMLTILSLVQRWCSCECGNSVLFGPPNSRKWVHLFPTIATTMICPRDIQGT
jgi:hypothetical protein